MTLPERLVAIRERNGYTRKRLAEELGKPYTTLTKYENGEREAGSDYLVCFAEKFNVTVDYLLGRVDDPHQYYAGQKKAPASAEAETGEVTAEQIMQTFVSAGLAPAGQDLTGEDLRFLQSIFAAIANWFASRDARLADSDKSSQ